MDREIEFRGKRVDNGEWVIGNLVTKEAGYALGDYSYSNCWIITTDGELTIDAGVSGCSVWTHERFVQVDPKTVGQFTGLRDSKRTKEYPAGQRVYEGDALGGTYGECYVAYCDTCKQFQLVSPEFGCMACLGDISWREVVEESRNGKLEIIGNVWERRRPRRCPYNG